MIYINQPYHLVNYSPWAFLARVNALSIATGLLLRFSSARWVLFFWGGLITALVSYQWWRDIRREGAYEGNHVGKVYSGLYLRIIFFIISEIFFFFSFFWGYFHRRLSINIELGFIWPPVGLIRFNPYRIPLLNRVVLLSSGVTVTWAHHRILSGDYNRRHYGFLLTLLLGGYFTFLQALEYIERFFCLRDRVYGSIFFLATGFHGVHVIVGRLYLLIRYFRLSKGGINSEHHVGVELSIWYWHFVDVVWLFLYIFVYWWWF